MTTGTVAAYTVASTFKFHFIDSEAERQARGVEKKSELEAHDT